MCPCKVIEQTLTHFLLLMWASSFRYCRQVATPSIIRLNVLLRNKCIVKEQRLIVLNSVYRIQLFLCRPTSIVTIVRFVAFHNFVTVYYCHGLLRPKFINNDIRDWSLITGRAGLQNGKIAGSKLFAPPPPDRVKLFTPPPPF